MKLFLHSARQVLEYAAERAFLSASELVDGFGGVAFVLLAAAPPPLHAGPLSLGLVHQGLLVLMPGCDVPLLRERGSRTEQSHW